MSAVSRFSFNRPEPWTHPQLSGYRRACVAIQTRPPQGGDHVSSDRVHHADGSSPRARDSWVSQPQPASGRQRNPA